MRCTDTTPTEALMNKAQERLRTTGRSIVDFDMMAGMIVTHRQTRKGDETRDAYEFFEITDQHPHTVYLGRVEKTYLQP